MTTRSILRAATFVACGALAGAAWAPFALESLLSGLNGGRELSNDEEAHAKCSTSCNRRLHMVANGPPGCLFD